ncbi:MAG: hypothetical protein NT062_39005, partial [Proteobacteria bacterium]|nr:hypothetical protein [Pseudomonadota bacterium]
MRIALCAVGLLVGCQRSKEEVVAGGEPSKPATALGVERADCRPDHTCDTGLLCLSNLCVRPPAADCALLGETLASLELGNYAPREQRNALVADKRTRCEREHVTKDEQKCVDDAHADKWAIAKCVPRLFPEMQPGKGAAGDCELVVAKIKQMMG